MNTVFQWSIAYFARNYPEYGTAKGATGNCRIASGDFCGLLQELGMDAVVDELDVVDGVAHKAVRVGNLWIDWTARQFNPAAPWPRIVKEGA